MGLFTKDPPSGKGDADDVQRPRVSAGRSSFVETARKKYRLPVRRAAPSNNDSVISPRPSVVSSVVDSEAASQAESKDSEDSDDSTDTIELFRPSKETSNPTGLPVDPFVTGFLQMMMQPRRRVVPSHMTELSSAPSDGQSYRMRSENAEEGLLDQLRKLQGSLSNKTADKKSRYQKHEKWSILHTCAQEGKLTHIKALIGRGADIEVKEDNDWTPIIIAAQNGHIDVVREFMLRGACINHAGDDGVTALRQAAQGGHLEVVELLLSHGADPNASVSDRAGPLCVAVMRAGHPKEGVSRQLYVRIVRGLIRAGADVNAVDEDGDSALHIGCLIGDLECVKLVVAAKADVNMLNRDGRSPLTHAAYNAKADIVRHLIENGAEVNQRDNPKQWTPLHYVSQFLTDTTLETVKVLVENGADVNSRTEANATALHLAAQEGDVEIIRYLIQRGASVDARTETGRTPLFQAAGNGHADAVRALANAGADVNAIETKHMKLRPLHMAVVKNDVKMVQTLLSLKADPNTASGERGRTPLALAAMHDDGDEVFMLLLDHGAHPV